MIIINNTKVALEILGDQLQPGASRNFPEDTVMLSVRSDIGRCIIKSDRGEVSFKNFGDLVGQEGEEALERGRKHVVISSID
jgi:hypothetical protein